MGIRLASSKLRLRNGKPSLITPGVAAAQPVDNGTGLAVPNEPLVDQNYQRLGGSAAVPLSGIVTGADGVVEARVVDESGVAVTGWAAVGTSIGGVFSGVPTVPESANFRYYKWQTRKQSNPGAVATGANSFCVGAYWLWSGQSNMVNTFTTPEKYPTGSRNAKAYDAPNNKRGILGNRATNGAMPSAPFILFGQSSYPAGPPWLNDVSVCDAPVYFANMLAQALGVPVTIVLSARGGASIDSWLGDDPQNDNWAPLAAAVAAVGGDVEGMLWSQGEADTLTKTTTVMRSKWDRLQTRVLGLVKRTTATLKIGMVSLGPCDGTYAKSGIMRANQTDYANTTAGWFLASSAYDANTPADHVHQDGPPLSRVYRRAARSALAAVYGIGASGAGPKIDPANVKLIGSDIFANVIHAGGTALADGAGGTGASVTSLEVKDSTGAVIPYVLQVTAAAQFKLSLAASFVAPLTVSNAYMDVPCGAASGNGLSFDPARCLYDNLSYVNKTMGGAPLQPCAPIAVS
jgi:hypothetical protein